MRPVILLSKATAPHKWKVVFPEPEKHTVSFGAAGYEDYTIHKNSERMNRYIARHRTTENWTQSGKYTPGFWSRWLLWSSKSMASAIKNTENALGGKYKIKMV